MIYSYFLGANSAEGFYSLYKGFCRREGDYLHIIKGGPGTGKSGFMRAIGRAAEERGLSVEYVLCSGDSDSLDGVYIPALKQAWADGTAPHTLEPYYFGIDSDYVNLGQFCATPLDADKAAEAAKIFKQYRAEYDAAYEYIRAAAHLEKASRNSQLSPAVTVAARDVINALFDEAEEEKNAAPDLDAAESPEKYHTIHMEKCFLHALSCAGEIWLNDSLDLLCKQYYEIQSSFEPESAVMDIARAEAAKRGYKVICSMSPVLPERIEALIIPQLSLGFVCGGFSPANCGLIDLDALFSTGAVRKKRNTLKGSRNMSAKLIRLATDRLSHAKELHDRLEEYYKAAMDFDALDLFTLQQTESIFQRRDEI